jgi:hypothetical protein
MRNLYDRFAAAMRTCVGPEPIKVRLNAAWLEHLDVIQPAEMPDILQQEFRTLRRAMYAVEPLPDEAEPTAAIRKMSAAQAGHHTATILKLATELLALCINHDSQSDSETQQLIFGRDFVAPERLN